MPQTTSQHNKLAVDDTGESPRPVSPASNPNDHCCVEERESGPYGEYEADHSLAISKVEGSEEEDEESKGHGLLVAFLAMVLVGLGNKVFQKLQTRPMYNYPFLQSLLSTVSLTAASPLPQLAIYDAVFVGTSLFTSHYPLHTSFQ